MFATVLAKITRDNIDRLLDDGQIEARMYNTRKDVPDRWWRIKRNGQTWRGKQNPARIRIPYKCGLSVYGAITEKDFLRNGELDPNAYRISGV